MEVLVCHGAETTAAVLEELVTMLEKLE